MATKRTLEPATEMHRRPRGTGTIRQRGNTYTACWFTTDPATGKRQQQSKGGFESQATAQAHLTSVLAEVQRGTFRRDERITVKQLFEDHWLPVKRSQGNAPNTIAYHEYAAKRVEDRIGALRVEALTEGDIARMITAMEAEGLSPRSRQASVGTLKAATAWAARTKRRLIAVDPLGEVHRPKLGEGLDGVKAWNAQQARKFLASVADDRHAACWALMITRGLRRGELAGLKWSAVDIDRGRLIVKTARVVVKAHVIDSAPKTKVGRTITLDELLVARLRTLRATQAAEAEAAADAYVGAGYVMADEIGRPIHPDTISRRFDALVTKAGLPRLTVHGLRHTAATLMLADGVPTKIVSEMLGHRSTTITLSTYAHVLPGMAEDAGAALSKSLLG